MDWMILWMICQMGDGRDLLLLMMVDKIVW